MKPIDISETGISLSRIFRILLRNLWLISINTIFGLVLAIVYTQSGFMNQGLYESSGSVAYKVIANATILNTITEVVRSPTVAEIAADSLEAESITFNNGALITSSIIQSTLTATTSPNSLRILVSFGHSDKDIVIPVVNAVIDATILYGNANYSVFSNNLELGEYASQITFEGISSSLYLLIGLALGSFIGGVVGIFWDLFKGSVFSAHDLKDIGIPSRSLKVDIKRLLNKSYFKTRHASLEQRLNDQKTIIDQSLSIQESLQILQNDLESVRPSPQEPLTTFISSPYAITELPFFAYVYAEQSAHRGVKTILIEADLKSIPLTTLFHTLKQLSKQKKSKDDFSIIKLSPNLDVLLGLPKAVPATHLRSNLMKQFIEDAKKSYGHIVISAPPMLPNQAALSVLPYTNAAILVTKSSVTSIQASIQAFNILSEHNVQAFEAVVYEPRVKIILPKKLINLLSFFKK
jgi:Mrp family chromosome partitioning ATPase